MDVAARSHLRLVSLVLVMVPVVTMTTALRSAAQPGTCRDWRRAHSSDQSGMLQAL